MILHYLPGLRRLSPGHPKLEFRWHRRKGKAWQAIFLRVRGEKEAHMAARPASFASRRAPRAWCMLLIARLAWDRAAARSERNKSRRRALPRCLPTPTFESL